MPGNKRMPFPFLPVCIFNQGSRKRSETIGGAYNDTKMGDKEGSRVCGFLENKTWMGLGLMIRGDMGLVSWMIWNYHVMIWNRSVGKADVWD